jgi:hypothetical protein
MPAEPPRNTEHKTQHYLLDGLRALRSGLPASTGEATLASIDAMIARLEPMVGLQLPSAPARLYGLTHSLRTLVEDIAPYSAMEYGDVVTALQAVERDLLGQRPAPEAK